MTAPDAVEAAARAIHAARCDLPVACGRATSPDRQAAQLALAAAAPLIAQQTLLGLAAETRRMPADADLLAEFLTARAATLTPKDTP